MVGEAELERLRRRKQELTAQGDELRRGVMDAWTQTAETAQVWEQGLSLLKHSRALLLMAATVAGLWVARRKPGPSSWLAKAMTGWRVFQIAREVWRGFQAARKAQR